MLGRNRSDGNKAHRVGVGATFEGTLRFSGRLEIEGAIVGAVIAEPVEGSEVIVGREGRVDGPISAATIVVYGIVQGAVHCSDRLDVQSGARLDGDVNYKDLQIQHGAIVEGSLKPIEGEQVALKLVANSRI